MCCDAGFWLVSGWFLVPKWGVLVTKWGVLVTRTELCHCSSAQVAKRLPSHTSIKQEPLRFRPRPPPQIEVLHCKPITQMLCGHGYMYVIVVMAFVRVFGGNVCVYIIYVCQLSVSFDSVGNQIHWVHVEFECVFANMKLKQKRKLCLRMCMTLL